MDKIEFLTRTNHRHLKTHIEFKIKEAFQQREEEVNQRRERLRMLLATEELQQEQELAYLFRLRILENEQKRLDWEATAKFQKAEAEKEFLMLKQIQRELLNCEEMRPQESKKITEETKRIQLLQIAEKRGLELKEKEIDQIWLEASQLMEKEKEQQELYERHLKDIIAENTVDVLRGQIEYRKFVKEMENEEKREENITNERERNQVLMEADFEARQIMKKKLQEQARQISELKAIEIDRRLQASRRKFFEAKENVFQAIQLKHEEEIAKVNKENEKESFNRYMQYTRDKKSEMNCRDKLLDTELAAFGRRMQSQPVPKRPYQKSVR